MRSSVRSRLPPPEAGLADAICAHQIIVRETSFRMQKVFTKTSACVISDIVKRRSIRAGSPQSVLQNLFCFSPARTCAYLQTVFGAWPSQDVQVVKRSLSATLDRIAVGSILRSNLVFLIISSCMQPLSRGRADDLRIFGKCAANILPSVWILIMRAIKCLKGVRWMPWR